jgi:chromosome partitioning protein
MKTCVPNLDIITSNINLSAAEIELVSLENRESVLKRSLGDVTKQYDITIIDCPPSLGLLTINALTAANEVLIPMQCEFYAMEGLSNLLNTTQIVKKKLNPELKINGILLTMYDKRNRLTAEIERDVRRYMKDLVFDTVIPKNVRMSEAPSHGKPIMLYDHRCSGSIAYMHLAREILERRL